MWSEAEVARYITGRPQTEEESWSRFLRLAGHWALLGYGFWMVTDKATGEMLGKVGYVEGRRAIEPSIQGEPELGWSLKTSAMGKGIAQESALAALDWGRKFFGPVRTLCIIEPANVPSIRLAEKLGFVPCADTVYNGKDIRMFERPPAGEPA